MDALFIICGFACAIGGLLILITGWRSGAWKHSPPWVFAGLLFSFAVAFLAMYAGRQLPFGSGLEWLVFLVRMAGLAGVVVFAVIANRHQKAAGKRR